VQIAEPAASGMEYYGKLAKRKVVGIYISGHPLDDYKFEMQYFGTYV
jgi:DNA polymerase-3 subunit alpha